RGRAEAVRGVHGEISSLDEPAEPRPDDRHGRAAAIDRRPAQRDQGDAGPDERRLGRVVRIWRDAATAAHQASAGSALGRAEMNAPSGLDLASIPERIQSEVQRAIQRSIKGVEYFSTSGPTLGSTPKDIIHSRGTLNLYHYRPLADEVYRVPILIVM